MTRTAWGLRLLRKKTKVRSNVSSSIKRRPVKVVHKRLATFLTQEEKDEALRFWIKKEQKRFFEVELRELTLGRSCPSRSSLACLNPVVDEEGVMRVGGRLETFDRDFGQIHPIIVPDISKLSIKMVQAAQSWGCAAIDGKFTK